MIKVTIVYPADPIGVIPGGIDTCIRDVIRSAPDDFEYSLLGATTDPVERPVKKWTTCYLGDKKFNFYPLYAIENPEVQPKIPATFKHLIPLFLNKPKHDFDVLQFHRIEPVLPYLKSSAPKFTFIHQNMAVVESKESDIRWKHLPGLYFKMEDWLIKKFNAVYCVHQNGVDRYKKRYPEISQNFEFLPTWMNPDVFYPASDLQKNKIRNELISKYCIDPDSKILLAVGRIDKQKNPNRLLTAFNKVVSKGENVHLLMIGDGVLRHEAEELISRFNLSNQVTITGLLSNDIVGKYLRGSDILVLASDYEGMPRCVVESLGCGVPVATTDVGEVKKVVKPGVNGQISKDFTPEAFAETLVDCISNIESYKGKPCCEAVQEYTPVKVLSKVYNSYRSALEK